MATPLTVLIVEDDSATLALLEYFVESQACQAILAPDLATARQLIAEHQPVIAILDLQLPDGDGTSLVEDIRRLVPKAGIAVLSGSVDRFDEAFGWKGVDITFPKPIDAVAIGEWLDDQVARFGKSGQPQTRAAG